MEDILVGHILARRFHPTSTLTKSYKNSNGAFDGNSLVEQLVDYCWLLRLVFSALILDFWSVISPKFLLYSLLSLIFYRLRIYHALFRLPVLRIKYAILSWDTTTRCTFHRNRCLRKRKDLTRRDCHNWGQNWIYELQVERNFYPRRKSNCLLVLYLRRSSTGTKHARGV